MSVGAVNFHVQCFLCPKRQERGFGDFIVLVSSSYVLLQLASTLSATMRDIKNQTCYKAWRWLFHALITYYNGVLTWAIHGVAFNDIIILSYTFSAIFFNYELFSSIYSYSSSTLLGAISIPPTVPFTINCCGINIYMVKDLDSIDCIYQSKSSQIE